MFGFAAPLLLLTVHAAAVPCPRAVGLGASSAVIAVAGRVAVQEKPPRGKDGWATARPEDVQLDPERLAALTLEIEAHPEWNLHAVLVVRDAKLVYERYFEGKDQDWGNDLGSVKFSADTLHDLRSVSKTVTSSLVGIAMEQGKIPGVDATLPELFPEHAKLLREEHAGITLEHLLTMSSGIDWDETLSYDDPRNSEIQMIRSPDAVRYVLEQEVRDEPGARYCYGAGCTALLAGLVEHGTKKKLDDYARKVLFEPLGIRRFTWHRHESGDVSAASGLRLFPRDLAKFGFLYLREGRWKGRQVIPEEWVRESVKPRTDPGWTVGYGYQWFIERFAVGGGQTFDVPTCVGNGGQKVYVVKELDLLVVVQAGNYNTRDTALLSLGEEALTGFVFPAAGIPEAAFRLR